MKFSGGTFGPGGMTLAKAQNDSVTVLPGQNAVKVVVVFHRRSRERDSGYVQVSSREAHQLWRV